MAALAVSALHSVDLSHKREITVHPDASKNFDFTSKTKFESQKASTSRRSRLFKAPTAPYIYDVWKLQPPNFNPQAFEPTPVQRNTREAIRPWRYDDLTEFKGGTAPTAAERRHSDKRKQDYFRQLDGDKERRAKTCSDLETRKNFQLRFHIADPYEARIEFVKYGTNPSGPYQMPQPHDFRQYPSLKTLGLDEFATDYQRDCMGLKTKSEGLRTLVGGPIDVSRKVPFRTKSEYARPRHPKWDTQLILPKLPFPNKIAAFSRHRRMDRSARSAYMERAEAMMIKRQEEINRYRRKFLEQTNS